MAMMESATGLSMEAPKPCNARKKMSWPMVWESEQSSEPRQKTVRPIMKQRRRPKRSDMEPENMRKEATTRV